MAPKTSRPTKTYAAPVLRRAEALARATAVSKSISGTIVKDSVS